MTRTQILKEVRAVKSHSSLRVIYHISEKAWLTKIWIRRATWATKIESVLTLPTCQVSSSSTMHPRTAPPIINPNNRLPCSVIVQQPIRATTNSNNGSPRTNKTSKDSRMERKTRRKVPDLDQIGSSNSMVLRTATLQETMHQIALRNTRKI